LIINILRRFTFLFFLKKHTIITMKKIMFVFGWLLCAAFATAQSPVGKWKVLSHISEYDGQKFDSHEALLQQRPCAAKIVYEINSDGTFRLNASASDCDERYRSIQQKLYAKTKWKVEGEEIMTSSTDFAVGQRYRLRYEGNKMIWTGTEGQGVITYQRLE
jgi:hypothetical protein